MKHVRKRITFANVMSSIAVFLVLGGTTAFAATKIGANEIKANAIKTGKIVKEAITTSKLKNGAVNGSKVLDGSLTGPDINASTLGTVPSAVKAESANTANSANSANTAKGLAGHTLFNVFSGAGTVTLATVGPFTVQGACEVSATTVVAKLQILSGVNGSSSTAEEKLDVGKVAEVVSETEPLNERGYQTTANEIAIAPDGLMMLIENPAVGVSVAGKPNQCQFVGVVSQLG